MLKLYLLLLWLLEAGANRQSQELQLGPDTKNYYDFMGLSKDADEADIRRSYKKLALKYHPDKGGDADQFKFLQEAYGVLGNPQTRARYDETGDPNPQPVPQQPAQRPARSPAHAPAYTPAYKPRLKPEDLFGGNCKKPGTRFFEDVFENYCACDNGLKCKGPKDGTLKPGCLAAAKPVLYHWMCDTCRCLQQNGATPEVEVEKPKPRPAPKGLCTFPSDTFENGLCVCHDGKVCMTQAHKRGCGQSDIHAYQPGCRHCLCGVDLAVTRRCCKTEERKFVHGKMQAFMRYEWQNPGKNWQGKPTCPKFPGQTWSHAEDHLCDQ